MSALSVGVAMTLTSVWLVLWQLCRPIAARAHRLLETRRLIEVLRTVTTEGTGASPIERRSPLGLNLWNSIIVINFWLFGVLKKLIKKHQPTSLFFAPFPSQCSVFTNCVGLRSAGTNRLLVPSVRLSTVGSRAFPVAAPRICNALSEETTSFRQHLKTWLFRQSYPDLIVWSVFHRLSLTGLLLCNSSTLK